MTLNLTTDYAIRIIVCLERKGNVLSASTLANEMEIPEKYLMKVEKKLKDGKLVDSVAGINGGYYLCKGLNEICLLDILNIMQPQSKSNIIVENNCSNEKMQSFYKIKTYYNHVYKQLQDEYLTKSIEEIIK